MTGELQLDTLADLVEGPVFHPGDDGYAPAAGGFNVAIEHRPDVVVGAVHAADVAAAVRYAARAGLPVAVQATGHGAVAAIDRGVLIDTSRMSGVTVDPVTRIATVQAGAKWRAVIDAATPHGLAALCGSSSDVGAVGYTVGGGLPVLGRTFGFAADHVRAFEVVTADGSIRRADSVHLPDLFWALRGGKGNVGIVTSMDIALAPVDSLYGGGIFYSGRDAAAVLGAYASWVGTLPERTSTSLALLRLPPLPDIPALLRGQFVVHLRVAHVGDADEGARLLAPMRATAPIMIDTVGRMPYKDVDRIYGDPVHPVPFAERSALLRELSADAVHALLEVAGPEARTPLLMVDVRHLGGALDRPPIGGNAVGCRDAGFAVILIGVLAPPVAAAVPSALEATIDALAPYSTGGSLVNVHGVPGDAADRARCWPEDIYRRLQQVKRRYDPTGMFSFGHAISCSVTGCGR